jgi:hypothetical protein
MWIRAILPNLDKDFDPNPLPKKLERGLVGT